MKGNKSGGRIRKHLKEHRELYIGVAAGFLLVTATAAISTRRSVIEAPPEVDAVQGMIANKASVLYKSPSTVQQITVIHKDGPGRPGNAVLHAESGWVYSSQRAAAAATGISEGVMAGHLNGDIPHVHGQHFLRTELVPIPLAPAV